MQRQYQDLSKFEVPPDFRGKPAWQVQLWWIVQALFFHSSPQACYAWRRFLLRLFGAEIGRSVIIRPSASVTYPWRLKIGDYSWIGDDVVLYTFAEIRIGSHAVVSQKSYICAGSHNTRHLAFPLTAAPIVIEDECWIAADVFISPGVTVGKGTIVSARSTVTKSLPAGGVAIGTPAEIKHVRDINSQLSLV